MQLKKLKFLDIKGLDNIFAGLTSSNDLYVWGRDISKIVVVPSDFNHTDPILIEK